MQKRDSFLAHYALKGAPIESMPPSNQLLHWTSATHSVCGTSREVKRILIILNRRLNFEARQAIRETYADFSGKQNQGFTMQA